MSPADRDLMRIRLFILASSSALMFILGWLTSQDGWRVPYNGGYSVPVLVFWWCGWLFERKGPEDGS